MTDGVASLGMGALVACGGLYALYECGNSFRTGAISGFGRGSATFYIRSNPFRFVLSWFAWALIGATFTLGGVALALSAPALHFALVPSYAGPLTALYLLVTRRQHPVALTPEVLVERILAKETAATTAAMLADGPTKRLLALVSDLPREVDRYREGPDRGEALAALDDAERVEVLRLGRRALPAGLALVAPALWLALAYVPADAEAAWSAVAVALALAAIAALVARAQIRGVRRVASTIRERLGRPL